LNGRVAQSGVIYYSSHCLRADPDAPVAPQFVPYPSYSGLGIITTHPFDPPLQLTANTAGPGIRCLPHQGLLAAFKIKPSPLGQCGVPRSHYLGNLDLAKARLKSIHRKKLYNSRETPPLLDRFCLTNLPLVNLPRLPPPLPEKCHPSLLYRNMSGILARDV
jgi:hypothetical protein